MQRLKLVSDEALSNFATNFNLRHYIEAFFVAILRVAARKYDMGKENGFAELNMRQGLTHVHFSAHAEPFVLLKPNASNKSCLC